TRVSSRLRRSRDTLDAYKRVYRLELVAVVRPVATRSYVTDSPVASASPVYLLVPDWSLLSCICGARVRPRRVLLTRVTGLSPYLLDFVDAGWTSFSRRPRPIDDLWQHPMVYVVFLLERSKVCRVGWTRVRRYLRVSVIMLW
ncbi:hypothetical protein U1Q18_044895, partial [Sarracenia purpurea var. burkii]